jgi:Fe2+ or Zn2+ uptake regulation protein
MMQPLSDTTPIASTSPLTQQDIEHLLVQHGYRLTRPRAAVVKSVLQYSQPFTAEQLVADMGAVGGGIGRATIYRTLEILAAVDGYLVPTIALGKETTRWSVRVHGGTYGRTLSDRFREAAG